MTHQLLVEVSPKFFWNHAYIGTEAFEDRKNIGEGSEAVGKLESCGPVDEEEGIAESLDGGVGAI